MTTMLPYLVSPGDQASAHPRPLVAAARSCTSPGSAVHRPGAEQLSLAKAGVQCISGVKIVEIYDDRRACVKYIYISAVQIVPT